MKPLQRRVLGAVAGLAALSAAFAGGVVAGAASSPSSGRLDEAARRIADEALIPVDRDVLDEAAVQAMLRAVGDPYGDWSSDGVAQGDDGYAGVGVWLRPGRDGAVAVAQVVMGSPAAAAGVRVGDELVEVAGRPSSGAAPQAVAAALRGRPGSTVAVRLRRDGVVLDVVLRRSAMVAPRVTVSLERVRSAAAPVGRVVVPTFSRGTGKAVRDALAGLRGQRAAGVVLDLRGNPGGLLTEAVETASAFLDGGPVVTYVRRDGVPQRLDALGSGDTSVPVVVLVDAGTASAAEVVAGALQDRGRAVLVGSRTFGKGSVQEPRTLADGSSLELTVARYTTPSGRSLEGVGLEPDIEVAPSADAGLVVRRAVEVLTGLVAVAGGRG